MRAVKTRLLNESDLENCFEIHPQDQSSMLL